MTRQAAGATKAYFIFYVAAGVLYLLLTLFSNVIIARIERVVATRHAFDGRQRDGCRRHHQHRHAVSASLGWLQPHRHRADRYRHHPGLLVCGVHALGLAAATISAWPSAGLWRTIWMLVVTTASASFWPCRSARAGHRPDMARRWPALAFCTVIRGTPLLLQLWLLYYGLGSLFPQFPWIRNSDLWPILRAGMAVRCPVADALLRGL